MPLVSPVAAPPRSSHPEQRVVGNARRAERYALWVPRLSPDPSARAAVHHRVGTDQGWQHGRATNAHMPRYLDPHERRTEIAAAVWGLLSRGGTSAASFRRVAAETGLAVGSLRHFAATQELLVFRSMAALLRAERQRGVSDLRVGNLRAAAERDPLRYACHSLERLLPLSEGQVVEARAWAVYALGAASGVGAGAVDHGEPSQAPALVRNRDEEVRDVCRIQVEQLARAGRVHPTRDLDREGDRLRTFLEGLIWRAAVTGTAAPFEPDLLRNHLEGLAQPVTSGRDPGTSPVPTTG